MNTVVYARVSSKEQEEEGFSIPAQLKLLKDYAKKNNLKIVKEFVDVETAKQAGRVNFNDMIAFLKNGSDVKTVLCEKTDRLYRNFKDYVTINDLDLEIHLVKEGEVISKDSKSHQKFIHGIRVLMAKNYIDNLSEEVKKGQLEKAELGLFPSYAPIGYKNVEREDKVKVIIIDKSRAPIINKLFRLYATGNYSLSQIVRIAHEEGLRSRRGYRISKSRIEGMLKNPIYYGSFKWNGRLYDGTHEPIISKELFEATQNALSNYNKPKGRKRGLAFTGLLTCGRCGCAITGEMHKGKYVYYRCTGYKGKCGQPYVKEEILSEKFGEVVKNIQISENTVEWIKEALLLSHKEEIEYHHKQIAILQAQYNKLQDRIDKMYVHLLDEVINEEFYKDKVDEYKEEQKKILATIEQHQNADTNYLAQGVHILELAKKAYTLYVRQNSREQRKLLNFLLLNCTLNDENLSPTYRKPFDLLVKSAKNDNWRGGRGLNPRSPV